MKHSSEGRKSWKSRKMVIFGHFDDFEVIYACAHFIAKKSIYRTFVLRNCIDLRVPTNIAFRAQKSNCPEKLRNCSERFFKLKNGWKKWKILENYFEFFRKLPREGEKKKRSFFVYQKSNFWWKIEKKVAKSWKSILIDRSHPILKKRLHENDEKMMRMTFCEIFVKNEIFQFFFENSQQEHKILILLSKCVKKCHFWTLWDQCYRVRIHWKIAQKCQNLSKIDQKMLKNGSKNRSKMVNFLKNSEKRVFWTISDCALCMYNCGHIDVLCKFHSLLGKWKSWFSSVPQEHPGTSKTPKNVIFSGFSTFSKSFEIVETWRSISSAPNIDKSRKSVKNDRKNTNFFEKKVVKNQESEKTRFLRFSFFEKAPPSFEKHQKFQKSHFSKTRIFDNFFAKNRKK